MVWKCCLPIFSVLATVLLVLPTIGEGAQQGNLWRCHRCQAGTFVAQECSTSSGTRCAPCPAGTFTDHLNLLFRCIRCSTCLPGQVEQIACNREHDTLCVAEPVVSSGDIPEEESKFSNMFPDEAGSKVKYSEIPQLPKVEKSEEEPIPEELSGESPIKPHLFDMDAIEPVKAKKPTEEVTTVGVSEEVTTARLPENEAAIDDLIPIQEVKVDAQPTTAAVDTNVDGSGTVTLVIEEYPEEITKAPVQLEVAESEAPKTSPKPEIESAPSTLDTTLVIQQVPELVTEAAFDTFNEIGEPIKPSVPVSNASETVVDETTKVVVPASVPASTPAAQVEVTTTLTDAAVDSTTSFQLPLIVAELDSGIESEEQTDSSIDSGEVTETTRSFLVTSAPAVDTSTVDEPFLTTTVLLKKLVAPLGDTIDEDVAMRNKTSLADIIPLLSTTPRAVEDSAEHVATTTPEADEESTLKDVDGITSAVPIDLTTLEHAHLWINGSELLQEPAVDSASSEENKHLDVAIAAVICGIGLVVLAVIGVRYCVKKRSFKDMRVSSGCLGQSLSTIASQGSRLVAATRGLSPSGPAGTATYRPTPATNSAWP